MELAGQRVDDTERFVDLCGLDDVQVGRFQNAEQREEQVAERHARHQPRRQRHPGDSTLAGQRSQPASRRHGDQRTAPAQRGLGRGERLDGVTRVRGRDHQVPLAGHRGQAVAAMDDDGDVEPLGRASGQEVATRRRAAHAGHEDDARPRNRHGGDGHELGG